jgi:regulator of chromosome condensation
LLIVIFIFVLGLAQVTFGQHHILLLDSAGKVYSIGRHDYGVLGLGDGLTVEVRIPTRITGELERFPCVEIGCGTSQSFAVTESGDAFSWGMGTNGQLSLDDEEDALEPTKMIGKQLKGVKVVAVSSGGQHTLLLVKPE